VLVTAAAAAVIAVATAVALSGGKGKRQAARAVRGRGGGGSAAASALADDAASSVGGVPLSARSNRSAGGGPVAAATAAAVAVAAASAAAGKADPSGAAGGKSAAVAAAAAAAATAAAPAPARAKPPAAATPPPPPLTDAQVDAALRGNARILAPEQLAMARLLLEEDQAHLFAAWGPPQDAAAADAPAAAAAAADAADAPAASPDDGKKRALLDQAARLDRDYAHGGGLRGYLRNARRLLAESREGANPFDGYEPSVPKQGVRLDYASPRFLELERAGAAAARHAAFVLVAGGLGERLGYSGLKVALPTQMTTGATFLETYVRWILALQRLSGADRPLPLAIMTSDDTHAGTERLLEAGACFGAAPGQITLLKQEKVACLSDSAAHLALDPADRLRIQTKPHGHGDVHALLHSSGLARRWRDREGGGVRWVAFFQDTNALVFRALVPALGLSAEKGLDVNSVAVPRRAKEAIGAIATLTWRGKGGKGGGGGGRGGGGSSGGGGGGNGAAADAPGASPAGSTAGGEAPAGAEAGSPRAKSKTRRGRRGGRRHTKKYSLAAAAAGGAANEGDGDGDGDGEGGDSVDGGGDEGATPPVTPSAASAAAASSDGGAGAATQPQPRQPRRPPNGAAAHPNPSSRRRRATMTCNVEYNLLDPLLRATIAPDTGDADDPATGLSPFPGNINQLVVRLASYVAVLERTGGVIAEFVNPKYADPSARGAFKASTRLECMMQDYPRSLPEGAAVGFTVVNQAWAAYSPVKNGLAAAALKAAAGEPTHSAAAAEFDGYKSAGRALQGACGCSVPDGDAPGAARDAYGGVTVEGDWPRVALSPEFAPTVSELARKVGGGGGGGGNGGGSGGGAESAGPPLVLAPRSVLVLDGAGIEVKGPVSVDGALVVRAAPGARVTIGPMAVRNEGWRWRALPAAAGGGAAAAGDGGAEAPREEDAMRGFVVERLETAEYVFDAPGDYVLPPPQPAPRAAEEEEEEKKEEEAEERVLVAA